MTRPDRPREEMLPESEQNPPIALEAAEHGAGLVKFRTHATINLTFGQLSVLRKLLERFQFGSQATRTTLSQIKKKVVAAMQPERWER